jgi:mannose/fructose/N-acetylgalactosamine-specific phosphotransferase system component IID
MQGAGVGFALIPVLRRLYAGDDESLARALGRHSGFYNGHPYLSTLAIAAIARMEAEGVSAEEVDRFKQAVVSPLGGLGDRLVWARWRPLSIVIAAVLFLSGAAWWVASGAFLVLYNALHLGLRVWGLRVGWRRGLDVGRSLVASPLRRLPDRLTIPLALLSGAVLPLLALQLSAGSGSGPMPAIALALVCAALGARLPAVAGRLAAIGLLVGALVLVVLGRTGW